MPPLGAYGQGGGTGALSLHDERWPEAYRGALLTGDWGRSEVYRHDLKPAGASFRANQSVFLTIPRPTGMDIGADGRLYVASWRGGEASVYVGPQVGFLACVAPPGWSPASPVDPKGLALAELIDGLCGPNAASRFHCQREILRRGPSPETTRALTDLASDASRPLHGRVAALFALKQVDGAGSHGVLRKLAGDEAVREFALRALADRKTELDGVEAAPFRAALADPSPRVRAQAVIALGRLGDVGAAPGIIPLTSRPEGSPMPTTRPVKPSPTRTGPCRTWPCGPWSRSARSMPVSTRSTDRIAREPSAPCGRCTIPRPSRGSSRSCPRLVPRRRAATSWPRWCDSITARPIMTGAGGASGPTRPARTSTRGSGRAAGGSPRCSRRPSSTATPRPRRSSAANSPGGVSA